MDLSPKYGFPRHRDGFRSKALSMAINRKEEFLSGRISRELNEKVIRRAVLLDIPVQNLIGKICEGTFSENEANEPHIGASPGSEDALHLPQTNGASKYPSALGWVTILLNCQATCKVCDKRMNPQTYACSGLSVRRQVHVILCDLCSGPL